MEWLWRYHQAATCICHKKKLFLDYLRIPNVKIYRTLVTKIYQIINKCWLRSISLSEIFPDFYSIYIAWIGKISLYKPQKISKGEGVLRTTYWAVAFVREKRELFIFRLTWESFGPALWGEHSASSAPLAATLGWQAVTGNPVVSCHSLFNYY